ncbi:MAG: DUF465 domain-containing protein [Robiginitomaculum sp.]
MSDDSENTPQSGLSQALAALQNLRSEHRFLDMQITTLYEMGVTDMLKIARMKKTKLRLKDRIRALEERVTPDIIA